jgi:cell division septal protein FtsQ
MKAARASERVRRTRAVLRAVFAFAVASAVLTAGIYSTQRIQEFLIRDARFVLPGAPDYGLESPNLEVSGVEHASRSKVLQVFAHDYGRSIYLLPLSERRKSLLKIGWIKDAVIVRLWPNRVAVRITERQPAAFIQLRAEAISRWALIDPDGMILDPPSGQSTFRLPVLMGVRTDEPQAMRGVRVRRMQRMLADLGSLADKVSEVDAGDLDNLKVTQPLQDRAVVLMLGDRNFHSRLENFLEHYSDIHKRMPNASVLDLRLDDRITAVEPGRNGE